MANKDYIKIPYNFSCLVYAAKYVQKFENGTAMLKGILKTLKKHDLHAYLDSICEDEYYTQSDDDFEEVSYWWRKDARQTLSQYNRYSIDGKWVYVYANYYGIPDPAGIPDLREGTPMDQQYGITAYCNGEYVEVHALSRMPEYYKESIHGTSVYD